MLMERLEKEKIHLKVWIIAIFLCLVSKFYPRTLSQCLWNNKVKRYKYFFKLQRKYDMFDKIFWNVSRVVWI